MFDEVPSFASQLIMHIMSSGWFSRGWYIRNDTVLVFSAKNEI